MRAGEPAGPPGPAPLPGPLGTEEIYRAFFDESPIGKSATAPDGRLLRVNQALCRLLGYSAEELQRLDFAAVTHPDDLEGTWEGVRLLLSGEKTSWSAEKRYLRKDGSAFWARVTTSLQQDALGKPACFLTHIQDITERKAAEEALREAEERYRGISSAITDIAYSCRVLPNGLPAIDWITGATESILGYSNDEVKSLGCWGALVLEEDRPLFQRHVAGLSAGEKGECELRLGRRDGAVVWVSSYASRAASLAGPEPARLYGALVDVTDRRSAEESARAARSAAVRLLEEGERSRRALLSLVEDQARTEGALRQSEARYRQLSEELEQRVRERTSQLETSNRELEAFSYSVSHDLRAPLRAIDGFSGMIVDRYGAQVDAEGHRLLGVVRANARKMARLIDDLLAFSRSGRSEMHCGRLDMAELARTAFMEVAPDAGQRERIEFRMGDLPAIDGDSGLVKQVWVNLLANAVKFSAGKERPVIEVEGAVKGEGAIYRVRDNGAGFDMAYSGKLFGVFQRLHGVNEFEGTGVGLALVQRIVNRHGGRVWAEGAVGQGATFSFELPAAEAGARDG